MDEPETVGAGRPAAVYARAPQPNEREDTPLREQLERCRALAAELGYTTPEGATLADDAPATTLARPGLTTLLRLVIEGGVSAVFVHSVDRLGRPESRALEALVKELRRREVRLYVARTVRGYRYDPRTGELRIDAEEVAASNREEWRPPERLIIPPEYEPGT